MNLIDHTYFQKRLTAIPTIKEEVLQDLNDHIEKYEPEYLYSVLGVDLTDEFLAAIEAGSTDQRWLDLLNGVVFEYNDIKYKWGGFNNTIKESPIAYYVMNYFIRSNNTLFTGIGTVTSNSENSDRSGPTVKLVDVWNKMVEQNEILVLFIESRYSDYSTYAPFDSLIYKMNIYGI